MIRTEIHAKGFHPGATSLALNVNRPVWGTLNGTLFRGMHAINHAPGVRVGQLASL